jgi:(p)ppGpp synthase/HD superfamily hydrolase
MVFESNRFAAALAWATLTHSGQTRKETSIPYVCHLLGVAALVLEDGGSETEAIAALLHDSVEDQQVDPATIERLFGADVRRIVMACTDTIDGLPRDASSTMLRKAAYVRHLKTLDADALRVSLADKVDNARAIARDYLRIDDKVFERFNAKREGTISYYQQLVREFASLGSVSKPLLSELERCVAVFSKDGLTT